MLRVICKRGDDRLNCDEQDALDSDAVALAAIGEAERIFAHERARGGTAYRLEAGKLVGRLEQFDPQAAQINIVPRVAGG